MDTIMKPKYIFNYLIIAIFKVHLHHNCSCFHSPKSPRQKHSVGSKIRIRSSDSSCSWLPPLLIFKNLSQKHSFIIYSTIIMYMKLLGMIEGYRDAEGCVVFQATSSQGKSYCVWSRLKKWPASGFTDSQELSRWITVGGGDGGCRMRLQQVGRWERASQDLSGTSMNKDLEEGKAGRMR